MNSYAWILTVLLASLALFSSIPGVYADDGSDYVNEVLEEDQHHHEGDGYYYEDDDTTNNDRDRQQKERMKQQEEAERRKQEDAERRVQEQADRIAADREKKFEADLAKMNEDERKAAKKQKKADEKIVRAVLRAADQERLYAVLGIHNWNLKIPSREVNIAGFFGFTIPGFTLKETTSKNIKKAYRSRAMMVHPDKNRDGHAQEAFIAVENAASILTDKRSRAEYDRTAKAMRVARHGEATGVVLNSLGKAGSVVKQTFRAVRAVLGPFATPVIILGALML
jgi:hypothetical protein